MKSYRKFPLTQSKYDFPRIKYTSRFFQYNSYTVLAYGCWSLLETFGFSCINFLSYLFTCPRLRTHVYFVLFLPVVQYKRKTLLISFKNLLGFFALAQKFHPLVTEKFNLKSGFSIFYLKVLVKVLFLFLKYRQFITFHVFSNCF